MLLLLLLRSRKRAGGPSWAPAERKLPGQMPMEPARRVPVCGASLEHSFQHSLELSLSSTHTTGSLWASVQPAKVGAKVESLGVRVRGRKIEEQIQFVSGGSLPLLRPSCSPTWPTWPQTQLCAFVFLLWGVSFWRPKLHSC